jgi:hypothetical protein
MKRDLELARSVLLATEDYPQATGWVNLEIPGYGPEEVSYHVEVLSEAGLLSAQNLTTHSWFCWVPKSLTWEGHEFLDATRGAFAVGALALLGRQLAALRSRLGRGQSR